MESEPMNQSKDLESQALKLRNFYNLYETAKAHHKQFINYRQEHTKPVNLLPVDELEIRLDKIEKAIKIQREVLYKPDWEPNTIQFCFLLNLPRKDLSELWGNIK
ncbi:hypothetical protein F52700_6933 [Fusarium sp. NRRL 52700]|nr:hypothetical protein F52700_6933 [Fusarium sp. NRRL 52700]